MTLREPLNNRSLFEAKVHTGLSCASMVFTFSKESMSHTLKTNATVNRQCTKYRDFQHKIMPRYHQKSVCLIANSVQCCWFHFIPVNNVKSRRFHFTHAKSAKWTWFHFIPENSKAVMSGLIPIPELSYQNFCLQRVYFAIDFTVQLFSYNKI